MRIGVNFHVFDGAISGVEYYSLGLMRALDRYEGGHEVVVFTNRAGMVREYLGECVKTRIVDKGELRGRLRRILWEHMVLPREAERCGVDVLHCPQYVGPVLGSGVRVVVTVHDLFAVERADWGTYRNVLYYKGVMRRSARKAARVVCVSEDTAAGVKGMLGEAAGKVEVVYPGIDGGFRRRYGNGDAADVRERYGLSGPYVLYVGNVEPKKNVGSLVEAMKILRGRGWRHELVMTGERTWRSGRVMRELESLEWVKRIGYVGREDLAWIYSMADAAAVVSLREGFGFVAAEAMACGCPVVSSGRGALNEVCGEAAVVVDCERPESIADGIDRVLRDDELRSRVVRDGIERSGRFCWEKTARRMLEIYGQVCEEGRDASRGGG